jgi:hypothetical protein
MSYSPLLPTDDLSFSVPLKINEGFRSRAMLNVSAKSADFTVWDDDSSGSPKDVYLVTTGASTITATLPAVATADATAGRVVTILKIDGGAGSVTIDGDGSETINGSTTVSLSSQYDYRTLVSDGSEWIVISST